MKILHFADLHIRGSHLPEIKKCVDFMVETAISEQPDLIINSGDTFHSNAVQLDSEAARYAMDVHKRLADIAPVSVIIGTKSHDGEAAVAFRHINSKYPIHVTSDAPEQLFLFQGELFTHDSFHAPGGKPPEPDAIISAFPAPTKKFFQTDVGILDTEKQIAQGITAIFAGFGVVAKGFACPHILNFHFNISGAFLGETQQLTGLDIECSKDQIAMGQFTVACGGHIHKQQKIGENIFFAGSTQNNTFGEMDPKGFYIHGTEDYDSAGAAAGSDFIPTPTQSMIKIDDIDWRERINHDDYALRYPPEVFKNSRVRLRIKIFIDEQESMDKARIQKFFSDLNVEFTPDYILMPRDNVRSQRIQDLDNLADKIDENAKVLEEEVPEGIREIAERLEAGDAEELVREVGAL